MFSFFNDLVLVLWCVTFVVINLSDEARHN